MVQEEKRLELFGRLRVGVRARTLHFPVTLGRMNLAHRLNAVDTFSKGTGTIADVAFYMNGKLITRQKINPFVNGWRLVHVLNLLPYTYQYMYLKIVNDHVYMQKQKQLLPSQ